MKTTELKPTENVTPARVVSGGGLGWLYVNDRVPDSERQVLTWDGHAYGADTYDPVNGWVNACGKDIPYPITHWQELPAPPNKAVMPSSRLSQPPPGPTMSAVRAARVVSRR